MTVQIQTNGQQPATPAAQPAPTAAQQLAAAYDLEDSTPVDVLDITEPSTPGAPPGRAPARGENAPAPPSTPRPLPPRDPASGQFVRPDDGRGNDQPPQHPRYLVTQALDLGLSDDEIQNTPTDVLGNTVALMHRHLARTGAIDRRAESVQNAREQGRDPFTPPAGPQDPIEFGTDPGTNQPISEESYDPAIRSVFKLVREQADQIKQLQQTVQQLATREIGREQMTLAQQINAKLATFNDPRFGSGTPNQMDPQSAEYARCRAVWAEAVRLCGKNPTDARALGNMDQAYQNLYGQGQPPAPPQRQQRGRQQQVIPEPAPRRQRQQRYEEFEPEDTGAEWDNRGLAAPTHRRGARPESRRGPRAAEESVRRKLQELGQGGDDYDDIGPDDFLE